MCGLEKQSGSLPCRKTETASWLAPGSARHLCSLSCTRYRLLCSKDRLIDLNLPKRRQVRQLEPFNVLMLALRKCSARREASSRSAQGTLVHEAHSLPPLLLLCCDLDMAQGQVVQRMSNRGVEQRGE